MGFNVVHHSWKLLAPLQKRGGGEVKTGVRLLCLFLLFFSIPKLSSAQESSADSVAPMIDSTKIAVDTAVATVEDTSHIYDSSERYFNWKDYQVEPYFIIGERPKISLAKMVDSLKNDDDFWYVKKIEAFKARQAWLQHIIDSSKRADSLRHIKTRRYQKRESDDQLLPADDDDNNHNGWLGGLFRAVGYLYYIIWALIICAFVFAILFFLQTNKISLWRRSGSDEITEEAVEGDSVNIFDLSYKDLLQKALADGNLRLYIRIQYLQTIKLLSQKGLIQFSPEHTNFTYLMQMQSSPLYASFFTITRHYEYVWYGKFDVSDTAFTSIKDEITTFQNQITASK